MELEQPATPVPKPGSKRKTTLSKLMPQPWQRSPREYVLEVIGLGVSLDKHRQGKLWDALQKGHPFGTIREQDPEKYPGPGATSLQQKAAPRLGPGERHSRPANVLACPIVFASEPSEDRDWPPSEADPAIGIVAATDSNGLDLTLFVPAGYMLADHPDRLLEKAFAFFDAHPDVPYLVVAASDGLYFRHLNRPPGSPPLLYDGYYVPSMPASSALFVLARRERVDAAALRIRGHRSGNARARAESYRARPSPFPCPLRTLRTTRPGHGQGRLDALAHRPRVARRDRPFRQAPRRARPESVSLLHPSDDVVHVPKGYKPTPWFPIPWNKYQLEVFDRLPTLGYLHRPTYIQLTDADGKPLTRQSDHRGPHQGWQDALLTLPEAQRKAPSSASSAAPATTPTSSSSSPP
jgi:hypothetical protein